MPKYEFEYEFYLLVNCIFIENQEKENLKTDYSTSFFTYNLTYDFQVLLISGELQETTSSSLVWKQIRKGAFTLLPSENRL